MDSTEGSSSSRKLVPAQHIQQAGISDEGSHVVLSSVWDTASQQQPQADTQVAHVVSDQAAHPNSLLATATLPSTSHEHASSSEPTTTQRYAAHFFANTLEFCLNDFQWIYFVQINGQGRRFKTFGSSKDFFSGAVETIVGIRVNEHRHAFIFHENVKFPAKAVIMVEGPIKDTIIFKDVDGREIGRAHRTDVSMANIGTTTSNDDSPTKPAFKSQRADRTFLYDSLNPCPASWNTGSREGSTGCLDDTRVDVLAEIYAWIRSQDPGEPHLFWLHGMAGSGKTTIAHTVAMYLYQIGSLGADFFFSRIGSDRTAVSRLLTTIAYQLSSTVPSIRPQLIQALEEERELCHLDSHTQLRKLIAGPLGAADKVPSPLVFVFDALDEADDQSTVANVMVLLATAAHELRDSVNLKIFVTSRQEHALQTKLEPAAENSLIRVKALSDVQDVLIRSDIRKFLESRLREHASPKDIQKLTVMANNLFIFASTAANFILDEFTLNPRMQMDNIFSDTMNSDDDPFQSLDHLYLHVLSSAIPSDAGNAMKNQGLEERLRTVLGSVVVLFETLAPRSLELLIGCGEHAVKAALSHLGSVVVLPSEPTSGQIQLIHPSFPDFLTTQERCTDPRFFINSPIHHSRLALACFEQMESGLRRDICSIGFPLRLNSEVNDLQSRIKERIPAHLTYACRYWAMHLARAGSTENQALFQALEAFCSRKLLVWMEVLSLIGCLDAAVPLLSAAESWCSVSPSAPGTTRDLLEDCIRVVTGRKKILAGVSGQTRQILKDGKRFVTRFFEFINICAANIYYSALPFTPECRLYQTYASELARSMSAFSGREPGWDPCLWVRTVPDAVLCVAFSPDGSRFASASDDGIVRVWDTAMGSLISTLDGHKGSVMAVTFSPDGTRLISGGVEKTIRVHDATTFTQLHILRGHTGSVRCIAVTADGARIASGSYDGQILLWDTATWTHKTTLRGHKDRVRSVAFNPAGTQLVSGSYDQMILIWDVAKATVAHKLVEHKGYVRAVAFSPDGLQVISGLDDWKIRFWDAATGKPSRRIKADSSIYSIAFSPNGSHLLSGSKDGTSRLWKAANGKLVSVLRGHVSCINSAAFSPDGRFVLSGSNDKSLRLWDLDAVEQASAADTRTTKILCIAFSPDATRLATGSVDGRVHLVDSDSAKVISTSRHTNAVNAITFTRPGAAVASGFDDKTVCICDIKTNSLLHTLYGHTDKVTALAYTSDGLLLASGSSDQTVRLWDTATGARVACLGGHGGYVMSVCYSPDGRRFASGSVDGTARIWDAKTGTQLLRLGHDDWVRSVSFSPDGTRIATGSMNKRVRLWDASNGSLISDLSGHTDWVRCVVFLADGSRIISASSDNTIKIWDTETGGCISTLKGHAHRVNTVATTRIGALVASGSDDCSIRLWDGMALTSLGILGSDAQGVLSVAFAPGGEQLVSGSRDCTVRLWDLTRKELIFTFTGHSHLVESVTFTPDGTRIVSGSYDKTVRIWDPVQQKAVSVLTGHTNRIKSVAVSPDGKNIISGSHDQTIRSWDRETERTVFILGHTGPIISLRFSANDKYLSSESDRETLYWDTITHDSLKPDISITSYFGPPPLTWEAPWFKYKGERVCHMSEADVAKWTSRGSRAATITRGGGLIVMDFAKAVAELEERDLGQ